MNSNGPFHPGDVYCNLKTEYGKNGRKPKDFIVLNDYTQDGFGLCLTLISTSQGRHYPDTKVGYNKDADVFLIESTPQRFKQDSYFVMEIHPIDVLVLEELINKGQVRKLFRIEEKHLFQIRAALESKSHRLNPAHVQILFPLSMKKDVEKLDPMLDTVDPMY